MEISKASRSPAWSIPVTVRVKRTWMTWGWSEAQQTNVTKRQRQNKDESWIKSFSLFTLGHKRLSAKKPSFFVFVPSLFCFTLFLSTFSFITFFFVHFSLHLFVHLFCFSLLFLLSHFYHSFFFISISVCVSLSLYDRGQNTSPREISEGGGGNGHQCLKRRSLVGVFLSMTEGLSWWTWINQRERLGWWFLARFGSNSVFLVIEWLVFDTDSPRDIRWWMLIIISPCCLSPLLFSSCLPSFLNTCG